jgi:hypothetical protein
MHRAEGEFAAGTGGPEARVLEHLAHRIDAEDPVHIGDERRDLRRFVRIVLLFLG